MTGRPIARYISLLLHYMSLGGRFQGGFLVGVGHSLGHRCPKISHDQAQLSQEGKLLPMKEEVQRWKADIDVNLGKFVDPFDLEG